jgi:hypothetical protein
MGLQKFEDFLSETPKLGLGHAAAALLAHASI